MRGIAGTLLAVIGALHVVLGVAVAGALRQAVGSGQMVNPVESFVHSPVSLQFWFLMFGFPVLILGHLGAWVERRLERRLPAFVGWELLAVAALGVVLDPDSGFWLLLGLAVLILWRARSAAPRQIRDPSSQ